MAVGLTSVHPQVSIAGRQQAVPVHLYRHQTVAAVSVFAAFAALFVAAVPVAVAEAK